jgi:hypothetical protein
LVPEWAKRQELKLSCLHDGLQEWMRPDAEFDCEEKLLIPAAKGAPNYARVCDLEKMKDEKTPYLHPNYSGYTLINKLATENVRTLLLGHIHYSSLEIYQPGTKLVPETVVLDQASHEKFAALEAQNPIRNDSAGINPTTRLKETSIEEDNKGFIRLLIKAAGHSFHNTLENHELVIARLTTVANMSSQTYLDEKTKSEGDYYGFSVLEFKDKPTQQMNTPVPQLNGIYLYRYRESDGSYGLVGGDKNKQPAHLDIDRLMDVRFRRLAQIRDETTGSSLDNINSSDFGYLCGKNYKDDNNLLRTIFKLKTEHGDGEPVPPANCP